jgi:oligosaccharyltransferase complex subunit gamma
VRHSPDGPHPSVKRPPPYLSILVGTVAALAGGTALYASAGIIKPLLQSRNLWAAITLIAIILFTSGHMFNHIRKVPYVTQDKSGRIVYFSAGFQSQLGIETQVIAALCMSISTDLLPTLCNSH